MNPLCTTPRTAQRHRTDCAASGPLIARLLWPYGGRRHLRKSSEAVIEAGYAAVYQLESGCPVPRRLSAARLSSKWGLADCHGTTAGDLGKYLIEELFARLALHTSLAARRIDRDGLANRETQRLQLDPPKNFVLHAVVFLTTDVLDDQDSARLQPAQ